MAYRSVLTWSELKLASRCFQYVLSDRSWRYICMSMCIVVARINTISFWWVDVFLSITECAHQAIWLGWLLTWDKKRGDCLHAKWSGSRERAESAMGVGLKKWLTCELKMGDRLHVKRSGSRERAESVTVDRSQSLSGSLGHAECKQKRCDGMWNLQETGYWLMEPCQTTPNNHTLLWLSPILYRPANLTIPHSNPATQCWPMNKL